MEKKGMVFIESDTPEFMTVIDDKSVMMYYWNDGRSFIGPFISVTDYSKLFDPE